MEPLTHFLTGACIGRAGFNRKTAYATLAATLAAEAPELDIVWGFAGPVAEPQPHRRTTHPLTAVPVVAAAATGAAWLFHRWSESRRHRASTPDQIKASWTPVRWVWVSIAAFIASCSHILLDWTNTYGVRPFFPSIARWSAGTCIYIAEPVLWGLLLSALIFPWLFGLADREIGAR